MKATFEEYLAKIFGEELESYLTHGACGEFVRVNTQRATTEAVRSYLTAHGFEVEPVSGLEDSLRLKRMPYEPTRCLGHFLGWYVKQSLASQLPVRFLDARPGQTILDLCAAPGSKTTQIASAMRNEGCLYANDLAGKRMTPLAARLDAMGVSHGVLYNMAAERLPHLLPPIFDRVLADVPCTGLGHADILQESRDRYNRSKNPSSQYEQQYRILLTGSKLLKVGGRLVYSTCSLNPDENESVVDALVRRFPMKLLEVHRIPGVFMRPGITAYDGRLFDESLSRAIRVTPWENDTQGFFVAVLEKTDELGPHHTHVDPGAPRTETLSMEDPEVAAVLENIERYYGVDPEHFRGYRFLFGSRGIYCIDSHWGSIVQGYQRAGIGMAKRRGGIWRLSHTLIQRLGGAITKNVLHLNASQMSEICATGECAVDQPCETPYPVIDYGPMGRIASTYDLQNGRIYWKRSCGVVL